MRIFCYGRKSVYSDTSDSVDNQARMCREYCDTRLQVDSWTVFTDEDFSGSNTSRPGLQRMLRLIKTGQADALIVYQLDRLSRSVRDFSAIYAELEEHGVQFISLKEQIDTTTPIGRAMMYVTVVFAQMERETIAQRVRDNLLGLAKKGWWVGGRAPVGFRSRRVTDAAGRRHVVLEPDPDAAAYVRGLYDAYRDAGYILSQVEQRFKRARIRTKAGTFFSSTQIYQILHNPVYATADQETYDWFAALGCQMVDDRSSWDGTRGVLSYGRTTERSGTHELTEPSEWLIRTGHHAPIIPSDLWLDAQRHFGRAKFEKETKYPVALLKGVARCRCGAALRISHKHYTDKAGSHTHAEYYVCTRRSRMGSEYCTLPQIRRDLLDDAVLARLREIEADPAMIRAYAAEPVVREPGPDLDKLRREASAVKDKIRRLTDQLEDLAGSPAARHVIARIEELDGQLRELERQQVDADARMRERKAEEKTLEEKAGEIAELVRGLDRFTPEERNRILRDIVRSCTWDGETLRLEL